MALRMPRPFEHKTGVLFLNVRVSSDLVAKARARRISLPVEDRLVSIVVTDKVFLSLKTKDAASARRRFVEAYGNLVRQWAGPKPLTHKQLVALAGMPIVSASRASRTISAPMSSFEKIAEAKGA